MTKVRLKRVQRRFNDIFDEPFGEKRQDNRTQEQKEGSATQRDQKKSGHQVRIQSKRQKYPKQKPFTRRPLPGTFFIVAPPFTHEPKKSGTDRYQKIVVPEH